MSYTNDKVIDDIKFLSSLPPAFLQAYAYKLETTINEIKGIIHKDYPKGGFDYNTECINRYIEICKLLEDTDKNKGE